jgi:hypothetical protein
MIEAAKEDANDYQIENTQSTGGKDHRARS